MKAVKSKAEIYRLLSASDYLKVYDDKRYPGISKESRTLLESIKQWPLINITTLHQAWSHGSAGQVSDESGSVGLVDPKLIDS